MKALFQDEDAVSPVIGVVLMVAITVILAAVIGAFVLNLGGQQSATPQASFDYDYGTNNVTVTHDGGDTINGTNLAVKMTSSSNPPTVSSDVTAGDKVISWGSTSYSSGETVRVVYTNPNTGDSAVLATSEAP